MRASQWSEIFGILFLLAATATQMFYLDPLKREIEWRLAVFAIQQSAAIETDTIHATHIQTLQTLNASETVIASAEKTRQDDKSRFKNSNADVSDYLIAKQPVEDIIQWITLALFAIGSLLAGIGRLIELRTRPRP